MQRWKTICKIFQPSDKTAWLGSHAFVPIAENLEGDLFRVVFTARDEKQRSRPFSLVFDINQPDKILDVSTKPLIEPGALGSFDDSGAVGAYVWNFNGKKFLYYTGWNLGITVPFRTAIGLAVSEDGGKTYSKVGAGPIIDRSVIDPIMTMAGCLHSENGHTKVWYTSGERWDANGGTPKHYYNVKYATTSDGLNWERSGTTAIPFKNTEEYAIGMPRVVRDGNRYKMWFCCRGDKYKLGYAESTDGIQWSRSDESIVSDFAEQEWASEMQCYPFPFKHKDSMYMLYNGNDYGRTGFGLAELVN